MKCIIMTQAPNLMKRAKPYPVWYAVGALCWTGICLNVTSSSGISQPHFLETWTVSLGQQVQWAWPSCQPHPQGPLIHCQLQWLEPGLAGPGSDGCACLASRWKTHVPSVGLGPLSDTGRPPASTPVALLLTSSPFVTSAPLSPPLTPRPPSPTTSSFLSYCLLLLPQSSPSQSQVHSSWSSTQWLSCVPLTLSLPQPKCVRQVPLQWS